MLIALTDIQLATKIAKTHEKAANSKVVLTNAMIENDFMYVTDGFRIIKCPITLEEGEETPEGRLYLNLKALQTLSKAKASQCKVVRGQKFVKVPEFSPESTIHYPNVESFFQEASSPDGFELKPFSGRSRVNLFELLSGATLEYVEFHNTGSVDEPSLSAAFHEGGQSTFPTEIGCSDLASTIVEGSIAFNSEYLSDLESFPFDMAAFTSFEGVSDVNKFVVRHSKTGHQAILMATALGANSRHPKFDWV